MPRARWSPRGSRARTGCRRPGRSSSCSRRPSVPDLGLVITPEQAGWGFSGLRVLEPAPGGSHAFETDRDELIVLPLAGACSVNVDGEPFALEGRDDVFSAVSDFVYAPRDAHVEIASQDGGRLPPPPPPPPPPPAAPPPAP